MKRQLLFVLFAALLAAPCTQALAQDESNATALATRELLKQDRYLASCNHHPYIVPQIQDTKALSGYKPFYVSHYGRHGSRFHTKDKPFTSIMPALEAIKEAGLLTETGMKYYADLLELALAQQGLDGILTQVGSKEHYEIAKRLSDRCPQVFRQADKPDVMCSSTEVQRCIQSMANFSLGLKEKNPGLHIRLYTGLRCREYVCPGHDHDLAKVAGGPVIDSLSKARLYPHLNDIAARFFADPARAEKVGGKKMASLVMGMINAGNIARCIDGVSADPFQYLTDQEIYDYWIVKNAETCLAFSHSIETGIYKDTTIGRPILRDMIQRADEAIAGGSHCADLRFGHDTGAGPLLGIIGVEGYDRLFHLADAAYEWPAYKYIPMGVNLQMIFYRNKKGDVLVKVLRNEEETTIPAVSPFIGPYYKWSELRDYLLSRL